MELLNELLEYIKNKKRKYYDLCVQYKNFSYDRDKYYGKFEAYESVEMKIEKLLNKKD